MIAAVARVVAGVALIALVGSSALDRDRDPWSARFAPPFFGARAIEQRAVAALDMPAARGALPDALAAARLRPADAGTVGLAAASALAAGATVRGNRLFYAASGLGWRDPATQIWAIGLAAAAHRPDTRAVHVEALFRAAPDDALAHSAPLAVEGGNADRAALVRAMARGGAWVDRLVRSSSMLDGAGFDQRVATLDAARRAGVPIARASMRDLAAQRFAAHPGDAWRLWAAGTGGGGTPANAIGDGATRALIEGRQPSPFEWQAMNGARVVPDGRGGFTIDQSSDLFNDVMRVAVHPWSRRLILDWRGDGGVRLTARCVDGGIADAGVVATAAGGGRRAVVDLGRACPVAWLAVSRVPGRAGRHATIAAMRAAAG